MKLLAVFVLFIFSTNLSAQVANQEFANQAGDNIIYTYSLANVYQSHSNISDDSTSIKANVAVALTIQFERINGVSEVIYDQATNLISVTANLSAVLPKKISLLKQSANENH